MKKSIKFLAVTFAIAVFSAFSVVASACSTDAQAQAIMQSANTRIEMIVQSAQFTGNVLTTVGFDSDSQAVQTLCNSVESQTSAIMQQSEDRLEDLGYSFECESYTVDIGGNEVLIDPFIVIGKH